MSEGELLCRKFLKVELNIQSAVFMFMAQYRCRPGTPRTFSLGLETYDPIGREVPPFDHSDDEISDPPVKRQRVNQKIVEFRLHHDEVPQGSEEE